MKKTIFEEMGGTYIRHGDYFIPCLTLTEEEQRWIREMPHRAQAAAMIMLYAGLRRGELVPLLPGWHADSMPVHLVYPYARHLPARLRRFSELVGELVPKALQAAGTGS